MAAEWYHQNSGRQTGPVDSGELRRLAEAGIVRPETLVRQGDSGRWVRAEQVRGLFQRSRPAPSLGATPPGPPPVARLSTSSGESPIRHGLGAPAVNEASENPERVWPVTWAAIIAGSGTALLLLLWVLAFRAGSTPQQQADKDQPPLAVAQSAEPRASAPAPQPLVPQTPETPTDLELADPRVSSDAKQHRPDANEEFSASELYKRTSPGCIRVENYDRHRKLAACGSGFLVSPDGQVVTSLHVIRGADSVTVRLTSGAAIAVRGVLRLDQAHDLAVLDIGGSGHDYLQLSAAKPAVGTRVYAIGNPLGLDGTLSDGVVGGWPELDGVLYIQTTAAISPGSSGGPLLSADGTVIGITTASLRGGQNLNLAVPASAISGLLDEKQQPLTLAQVNARIGAENQHITTEDDPVKLAAVWDAIRANKSGDAVRLLAQVPSARRGTGYWIASGHLHFRLGNSGEAQAAFGKAVANDPNNTENLLRLALALRFGDSRKSSDWDAARDLCKTAMQLDPTNVPACIIRGISTRSDGILDYFNDESIGYFKTALALDPDNFGAQYNLGVAMLGRKNRDAWKPLQEALKLEATVNLNEYLVHERASFGVEVRTRPRSKSLHVLMKLALAQAYGDSDQQERAIQEYKEVLAVEPTNPAAPWGLWFAYGSLHNAEHPDAVYWGRRANEIDPMFPGGGGGSLDAWDMPTIVYNYFGMLR